MAERLEQDEGIATSEQESMTTYHPEVLAWPAGRLEAIVLDMDGTLYQNPEYRQHMAEQEDLGIAYAVGWGYDQVAQRLSQKREELAQLLGRNPRKTEVVLSLGLSRDQWDGIRSYVYRPNDFIKEDPQVVDMTRRLLDNGKRVAIATNSPSEVADKILRKLGMDDDIMGKITVAGAGDLGVSKPNPEFFVKIAELLGVNAESCLSIGDDHQNDAYPAIDAGMGAVVSGDIKSTTDLVNRMIEEGHFEQFDLANHLASYYVPGRVSVVGLTGRAGAGKTTNADRVVDHYRGNGVPVEKIGLDAFFKQSSRDRKAWLEEGKQIGNEEYWRRANQWEWWDFDKAAETIRTLKNGETVHLRGIYNRADKGELTGEQKIEPSERGLVVVFEGVATAHMRDLLDGLVYVNAHPKTRQERLLGRDMHRAGSAALERFEVTQRFESKYFAQHGRNADLVIDNSGDTLYTLPGVPRI